MAHAFAKRTVALAWEWDPGTSSSNGPADHILNAIGLLL
jgi:hypothetical protein